MATEGELVQLFVYDISGGLARSLSLALLGRHIDAVYHTGIVVGGSEYYFGGGINVAAAGGTPFGRPFEILDVGRTHLPQDVREALLVDMSHRYAPETYSLFSNNCNNFSDEFAQLLTGKGIPQHITALPETVLQTPFGQMLRPLLAALEDQMRSMRSQAFMPTAYTAADTDAAAGSAHVQQAASPSSEKPAAIASEAAAPPCTSDAAPIASAVESVAAAAQNEADAHQAPALLAAEKALEAATAEAAMADLNERTAELELKEGTATPRQQLGERGAVRLATERAVEREYRKLLASGHAAGPDTEALALEHVAAKMEACEERK